ncbi:MAG TPA: SIMPL domain-containing protein, partial [Aggregatilineales bacterium]|nr:SIMPL domain-containing protein [Aggregatilineales bacterium]
QGQRLFHVNNLMRVKVSDTERIGEVIEAGMDAGANTVGSLFFAIEDPDALEAQARADAVADARARAEQLAEAAGVQLGDLVNLTEGTPVFPLTGRVALDMAQGGGAPPISEGQLAVSVSVTASFSIRQ